MIIELDPKDNVSAAITSSTHDRKSRCNIFFKNQKVGRLARCRCMSSDDMFVCRVSPQMYLKHNSLGDDIPVVVVLKAMGLECDQEIVQFVGTEPELVDLFSGSLEEPYNLGIYSQEQVRAVSASAAAMRHIFTELTRSKCRR